MNNIANIYLQQNDLSTALSFAKKALEKAPNIPAVINTYGLIELQAGNAEEALDYLYKAYEANKQNQNYLVHYIQALSANQDYNEVNALLLKVDKQLLNDDSIARLKTIKTN
jgi:tetratricopeptide (TPR) repeat protein